MSEMLKEAREILANSIAERGDLSSLGLRADLRELQRQAIVAWVVAQGYVMGDLRERHITAVLDGMQPAFPVRCVHCGKIEEEHAHAFKPQSPRCHRAHPHQEPCA